MAMAHQLMESFRNAPMFNIFDSKVCGNPRRTQVYKESDDVICKLEGAISIKNSKVITSNPAINLITQIIAKIEICMWFW